MHKIDVWLLTKIFAPIAWWADKRFHINHYRIAAQMLMCSCFLIIIDDGATIRMGGFWMNALMISCAGLICCVRYAEIKKLERLSRAIERDPSRIPAEAISFMLPYGRMMHLWGGIFFLVMGIIGFWLPPHAAPWLEAVRFIGQQWFLTVALGYYMAALPPSPHKRVQKKARDWSFGLMPKPVRS